MGFEISSFVTLINNNGYLFAIGVAFCIIVISITMKSPCMLSNYNDQSILMKIKNDFRTKSKAVEDISKVKNLTNHVQEQTDMIKSSFKVEVLEEPHNDVSNCSTMFYLILIIVIIIHSTQGRNKERKPCKWRALIILQIP